MKLNLHLRFCEVAFLLLFLPSLPNCFGQNIGRRLNGIAYGNGTFVAAGCNRTIMVSKDGTNWVNRSSAVRNNIIGINFTTETYASGGDALTFIIPNDASGKMDTWTNSLEFHAVGFGNNLFVILGEDGEILNSRDGESWQSIIAPTSATLNGIVWNGNEFVAVGDAGTILTSTDGSTWSERISGTDKKLYAIAYGNGVFVAVGGDKDNSVILTSSDGIDWISNGGNYLCPIGAIAFGNNEFMASASGGWLVAMVSPDGKKWRKVIHPSSELTAVIYGKDRFIALDGWAEPVSSPDGNNWKPPFSQRRFAVGGEGAVYGNSIFVSVGDGFGTSADGIHWTFREFPSSKLLCGNIREVSMFMPSLFLRDEWRNNNDGTVLLPFLISDDGSRWHASGHNQFRVKNVPSISGNVSGNEAWPIGFKGSRFAALTSMDGITWTRLQTSFASPTKSAAAAVVVPTPKVSDVGFQIQLNGKSYNLNLSTRVGQVYQLQASTNLKNWVNLTTRTNNGEVFNFMDSDVAKYPQRFYRLKLQK